MRRGLSVVRGGIGTGKTTISRKLIQNFSSDDDVKFEFYPVLDPKFESELVLLQHLVDLFGIEEDLPDALIDWVDTVMDLGDGLDCICEIMLNYHKATILVNLETEYDMETLFEDIRNGRRSTNYLKMKPGLKVSDKSSGVLLKTNSVLQTNFFTKDFRREWV